MKTILTQSAAQTSQLAEKLAAKLKVGAVLALWGELGSGKTQFVKGLARAFGVKTFVISPTFILSRAYPYKKHGRKFILHHFDLYRLGKTRDILNLGVPEILSGQNSTVVVEWPQKIKGLLPKKTNSIFFRHGKKANERKICIPDALA